ncbi:MAG: DUF3313 domain-containing protein [Desulfobacterales bacterium]|nr:DUF3313 domain-containing protein [Desulfobacterales bacterium]
MANLKNIFAGLVAVFFLITLQLGCSTKEPTFQGFLGDYSKLQPDDSDPKGAKYWRDSNVALETYNKFILDEIYLYLSPDVKKALVQSDPESANRVVGYFKTAVEKALGPEYPIVDKAGPDVARLRIALTNVEIHRKDLKIYQYIPIPLALTGVGEVTGIRDRISVLSMEGEMLDSMTGQQIAAVVQVKGGEVSAKKLEDLSETDSYPILDYWAEKLKERIADSK